MTRLVLFAPGIRTGGGLVLLQGLLIAAASRASLLFLDSRAADRLTVPADAEVRWIAPTLGGRIAVERDLARSAAFGDSVVCFHGLPPLLPQRAHVSVFVQNRLHLGTGSLAAYGRRTQMRIGAERMIASRLRRRVDRYVVQTPSMRRALLSWHGGSPDVRVCPALDTQMPGLGGVATSRRDFVYVADGVPHKNHQTLMNAWRLLAADGLHPSLALTLGPRDAVLASEVDRARRDEGLAIENLGELSRDAVFDAYRSSRALIFPSTAESFGLPLIEAARLGVPIVASELDFVRDVCRPVQTFDPSSPVSLARAVRRFLDVPEPVPEVRSSADFLQELLA